ncbi:nitrilase, arylacetone-specific [Luminiphilus syltensis NOR5-1B]|uniref:Nitrilase, arylacetone-specific n=1 Tax=Luminiphilus syltensis NOR5-1B TaxID=565045 RepID=B8KVK8_9GAMM|nr:carbon-nitrogen hydrolase family protein [Luminiphilus syltensis]EED35210.1 nitrilase, arylacetone-specific [Luminiphilus syltensis NOR5-1B]
MDTKQNVRVAAVQAAPVFMDLKGTVAKTVKLIEEAAEKGCDLVVFPETWVPGYPWFIWLNTTMANMKYFGRYNENSLVVGSDEFDTIAQAAKDNNIHVSVGASERDHGSLYISQFLFGRDGSLLSGRRKLKPTHQERTVFGDGDGSDLCVSETDIGRVGQLACWEHLQPLSKYAMYSMHEQIHCGAWPSFSAMPQAYALGPEVNNAASQMYAAEGQCFVIGACGMVSDEMIDMLVENDEHKELISAGGGHAVIYGPDGKLLVDKIPHDQEGLLIADLAINAITIAKVFADPVGHYSRPDVTRLLFNRLPQPCTESHTPEAATFDLDQVEDVLE